MYRADKDEYILSVDHAVGSDDDLPPKGPKLF